MTKPHIHSTHPAIVARLKRAEGHLRHVIGMIESGALCVEIARQMQAVESAVTQAKRTLIHDHIDHCIGAGEALDEMKSLTRLL